jgi:hypothetical protein
MKTFKIGLSSSLASTDFECIILMNLEKYKMDYSSSFNAYIYLSTVFIICSSSKCSVIRLPSTKVFICVHACCFIDQVSAVKVSLQSGCHLQKYQHLNSN